MRELTTAAEVIEALGGIAAVAGLTNSGYRAAANWKSFNAFPPKTYVALTEALRARDCTAPDALWAMIPSASEPVQCLRLGASGAENSS